MNFHKTTFACLSLWLLSGSMLPGTAPSAQSRSYFTSVSNGVNDFIKSQLLPAPGDVCASLNANTTGGTVWEDWNYNGIRDENTVVGVSGITVNVYGCDGTLLGSPVTDTDGDWSLDVSGRASCGGCDDVRIEYTNLPVWASPTQAGPDNGTTVQFVAPNVCTGLGIAAPQDYCQFNPEIAVACYESGTGVNNLNPGLVSYRYNYSGLPTGYETSTDPPTTPGTETPPTTQTTIEEIGAVHGTAWQRRRQRLFLSSFVKRFVGLKDGAGYIYAVDFNNGNAAVPVGFDLQGIVPANGGPAVDLGSICRDAACANDPGNTGIADDYTLPDDPTVQSIDLDAFPKAATMSYGDAEIAEDGNTLFVVNLFQRAIITVDVSGTTGSLPGAVNQYPLSGLPGVPTCTGGIFRPWALAFEKGVGYLGGVCDASVSQDSTNLEAYVLSFDPQNITAGFTTEINFSLDYQRENGQRGPQLNHAYWQPWASTWAQADPYTNGSDNNFMAPQPVLSDLVFNERGDMTLGFKDRFGSQNGRANHKAISQNDENTDTNAAGDIVQVCRVGGTWVLEGGAGCAVNDNNFVGDPLFTLLQNDGPSGNGEFYFEDYFTEDTTSNDLYTHSEITNGALTLLKGTGQVVTTVYDPLWGPPRIVNSQGVIFFNTTTGEKEDAYQIVKSSEANPTSFAKANGLGDMELMCNTAPLEIGNYVWEDRNGNGVQDACEPPLSGITVRLLRNGVVTASTVTDAAGQYYFSHSDHPDQIWTAGTDSLRPETAYILQIADAAGTVRQTGLEGRNLTTADAAATNDATDSDAVLNGNAAQIAYTTGQYGQIDHTLDFGFSPQRDYADYQNPNRICPNAPCHDIDPNLYLGSGVSPDNTTDGDTTADGDNDDGILLGNNLQLTAGNTFNLPVVIYNNTGNTAYLRIWIDWNGNGDFTDAGEQAADNTYAATGGADTVYVPVTIPVGASTTQQIALRARLSTDDANSAAPCGNGNCAADGEIEDYLLQIECVTPQCRSVQLTRN